MWHDKPGRRTRRANPDDQPDIPPAGSPDCHSTFSWELQEGSAMEGLDTYEEAAQQLPTVTMVSLSGLSNCSTSELLKKPPQVTDPRDLQKVGKQPALVNGIENIRLDIVTAIIRLYSLFLM
jgi:hypothetical protein